jgi:hypothetical protein
MSDLYILNGHIDQPRLIVPLVAQESWPLAQKKIISMSVSGNLTFSPPLAP